VVSVEIEPPQPRRFESGHFDPPDRLTDVLAPDALCTTNGPIGSARRTSPRPVLLAEVPFYARRSR
jgi:hypothetical protein